MIKRNREKIKVLSIQKICRNDQLLLKLWCDRLWGRRIIEKLAIMWLIMKLRMKWKKIEENLIKSSLRSNMNLNSRNNLDYMNLLMKKSCRKNMNLNQSHTSARVLYESWADMTEETCMNVFMNSPKNKFESKRQQNFIKAQIQKQRTCLKFKNTQSRCIEKETLEIDWLKTQKWEVFVSKIERENKSWLRNSFESKNKSTNLKNLMKISSWRNIWTFLMKTA